MCETHGDSVRLILNDFDHATYVGEDGLPIMGNSSTHRIGTLPFMALDILENPTATTHYLRHDLESVFWVALWCLVKLPDTNDPKEKTRRKYALMDWESGTLASICKTKLFLIFDGSDLQQLGFTPEMQVYKEWITDFWAQLASGYMVIWDRKNADLFRRRNLGRGGKLLFNPQKVDDETLGGALTCEGVMKSLELWEQADSNEIADFVPYFSAEKCLF